MKFRVDRFSGEHPLQNHRKLPDGAAASAFDCDLVADDLRAFRQIATVANISSASSVNLSSFVFDSTQAFVFQQDVNATFGPIQASEDVKNKVFIDSGFQSYPVYTTKEIGSSPVNGPYHGPPVAWRKLGVPPPDTPPLAVATALSNGIIISVTVTAEGVATVNGSIGEPHGLKDSDRVRITGLHEDWSDVNNNTFTITVVDTTKFTLNNYDGSAHYGATASGAGEYTQEFNNLDLEDRLYVYTLVTDQGEEGPPSDATSLLTLAPGQAVTITTSTSPIVDNAQIAFNRIYRTVATSTGSADYYFVAEIPATQADYVDTLTFIELGEQLPSLDWQAPPANLVGLTTLPNGIMAGYVGRTLYMCEPYQPHAWPEQYTRQVDHDIVAMAGFGQSLVIVTDDTPYIGTGSDPLSMTLTKLDSVEPCISRRCCKTLGYAVIYPSPNGLMVVSDRGAKNILTGVWDERDWRSLFDTYSNSFAEVHDNKYYLFFSSGSSGLGIIFDPSSQTLEISRLTLADTFGTGIDRDEDRMFFLARDSGVAKFKEWNPDAGSTFIETSWYSRTYVMPYPVNMGAYQVMFDTSGTVDIDFYADGVLKHSATVSSQEPQRLPSGFLAREWAIEVKTKVEVQGVYVAETVEELRGALTG
jgi:hypothetical protein